ncbi:hypothetical protein HYC85_000165 [Camellia sinensis]|uniref:RNA polymerase sigma-70 domain-containing protein n=1 Tax=Camellia sinensis TaxID=4442 RepID=A0A7J7I3C9_CAMSI|nr:hypothetical protein HYC85_000165 [Camellia sinensis]
MEKQSLDLFFHCGKRLLSSSYYSDITEKLSCGYDYGSTYHQAASTKNVITANKSSNNSTSFLSNQHTRSLKAQKEHVNTASEPSTAEVWLQRLNHLEEDRSHSEFSVEALLLLQKSMLEKQWNLSTETVITDGKRENTHKKMQVTGSGTSARRRRIDARRKVLRQNSSMIQLSTSKQLKCIIRPELLQNRLKGYVKGVASEELLTHSEVVQLSKIIKTGLYLEEQKSRPDKDFIKDPITNDFKTGSAVRPVDQSRFQPGYTHKPFPVRNRPFSIKLAKPMVELVNRKNRCQLKERLGCEPSEEQLATSLRISRAELQLKLIEFSLARENLAMNNVRLVMSIAQRYNNMGVEMADLIQGGLIGLLRGIEKFDSSKGNGWKRLDHLQDYKPVCPTDSADYRKFVEQVRGVSRALVENARTLRLPTYLHERLSLIRNAKMKLEEEGIAPSIDRIAACLNMSQTKVRNATEMPNNHLENNPWHGVDEWALKVDEVNKLISTTLRERERVIIRLYYGLDSECLTWEDISRRIGLSRERVRQIGLVALEKLKHAARKRRLEAMLMNH